MNAPTATSEPAIECEGCGYDVRGQPDDGRCPECGMAVAESRELVRIPRRPAWRESDPRWRRRMLAGVWMLGVILPLMTAADAFRWGWDLQIPGLLKAGKDPNRTLGDTIVWWLDPWLTFTVGIVLLFAKERGRRHNPLDWTRRWGLICSYVIFLLGFASQTLILGLVIGGISALFRSMPAAYQPDSMEFLARLGVGLIHYAPQTSESGWIVLGAFSSAGVLLACIPLFNALRSCGPRWVASILIAPLAILAVVHFACALSVCAGLPLVDPQSPWLATYYFRADAIFRDIANPFFGPSTVPTSFYAAEHAKVVVMVLIASWLSVAQLTSLWRNRSGRSTRG